MMLRIFVAGLTMETNTFSPIPTGMESFRENGIFRGDRPVSAQRPHGSLPHYWIERATADGHLATQGLVADAKPAGPIQRTVYESLRDELLAGIRAALPVDVCLLSLHGAMVADGYDDCEGDLLARARGICGWRTIIAAEVDPHCHASPSMFAAADLLIAYKEYPHTDVLERGAELYDLALRAARDEIHPVTGSFDCRMVGAFHTTREPMRSFVDHMRQMETKERILSASFGHGFPWGDVPHAGARTWVIADGDQALADSAARELGDRIWSIRLATRTDFVSLEAALDAGQGAREGLVVVADSADNAGGGAPSDSTFVLRQLIARGAVRAASGVYWDPIAVQLCNEAGVGASLMLRLGGKIGPTSGTPLDIRVTVMSVCEEHSQPLPSGAEYSFGRSAWVRCEGVDIVISSIRQQVYHPKAFTGLGIDVQNLKLVVVKSSHHFYAGFESLAREILYAHTPGTMNHDYAAIPYARRSLRYWPRIEDPFRSTLDEPG